MANVGVVGHTEWVDFALVERLPAPGEIVYAREGFSAAAGGGGVAAVQLARLLGPDAWFMTALGEDELADRTAADLRSRGVTLDGARVAGAHQRRAFTHLTDDHERTITVVGDRLAPDATRDAAALDWGRCATADAIYFTGGDSGAARAARGARVLVATPRAHEALVGSGVQLDYLVASAHDAAETAVIATLDPPPRHVVLTAGGEGGTWRGADGTTGRWASAELPGEPQDAYGCGDTFAAALTGGLGVGLGLDGALELAARCGATCLTGRGPYGAELTPLP